jgi:hypothetical protein
MVMSDNNHKPLVPLQAINNALMIGVSTAELIAAFPGCDQENDAGTAGLTVAEELRSPLMTLEPYSLNHNKKRHRENEGHHAE